MTTLSCRLRRPAPPHAAQSSTNWRDLVLYDVIPEARRHVNDDCFAFKDYGDAAGDAYYAMRALLPPLLCDVCHEEPPGGDSFCARYNYIAVGTCYSEQATPGPQVARKISVQVPADVPFGTRWRVQRAGRRGGRRDLPLRVRERAWRAGSRLGYWRAAPHARAHVQCGGWAEHYPRARRGKARGRGARSAVRLPSMHAVGRALVLERQQQLCRQVMALADVSKGDRLGVPAACTV